MKRIAIAAVAAGAVALPATAQAHVSLHPNTLPAGSNPTLYVRVPNEEEGARTVKVDMQVPPGFTEIGNDLPPGWRVQVKKTKLAKPVKTDDGTITEQVSELIWTATAGGTPPDGFVQFPLSTAIPDNDTGKTLAFKVIQTYSNGKTVRWIGPPSAEQPAPTVNVTAAGGPIQDIAGTEAGPPPAKNASSGAPATGTQPKPSSSAKGASKGLGIAALIVGILALLGALAALGSRRRPRSA